MSNKEVEREIISLAVELPTDKEAFVILKNIVAGATVRGSEANNIVALKAWIELAEARLLPKADLPPEQ